jgi:uncharacterized membrane protein
MVPLIVLASTFGGSLLITALSDSRRRPNLLLSLRIAVGAMFFVTGLSHFVGMREELTQMVPDSLPAPELIVTVTGLLEIAASAAMTSRRLAPVAAGGLALLLVVMFPANINLALTGTELPWTSTLIPRTTIQLLFLAATVSLAILGSATVPRKRANEERSGTRPGSP